MKNEGSEFHTFAPTVEGAGVSEGGFLSSQSVCDHLCSSVIFASHSGTAGVILVGRKL